MPSPSRRANSRPVKVYSECWEYWGALIKDLHENYELPAGTIETLNGYLSIFHGEGSTFRFETEQFRMVLDVIRDVDMIIDIVTITLISKLDDDRSRTAWVISRPCNIHTRGFTDTGDASLENISGEDTQMDKPVWYRISEGGKHSDHCCVTECAGPFKEAKSKTFDTIRLGIINKNLEQEIVMLRGENDELYDEWQEAIGAKELLKDAEHRNNTLRDKNSEFQSQVDELEAQAADSDKRHAQLTAEMKALSEKYDKVHRRQKKGKEAMQKLQQETDAKEERIEELAMKLEEETDAKTSMHDLPAARSKEADNLRDTVRIIQRKRDTERRALQGRLNNVENNLRQKEAQLSNVKQRDAARIMELQKELREAERTNATHTKFMNRMTRDWDHVVGRTGPSMVPGHNTGLQTQGQQRKANKAQQASAGNPNMAAQPASTVFATPGAAQLPPASQPPTGPRSADHWHGPLHALPYYDYRSPGDSGSSRHTNGGGSHGMHPQIQQPQMHQPPIITTSSSQPAQQGKKRKRNDSGRGGQQQ
ncbi:hypothetical protein ACHAQA_009365 [Verticillium albo-atrum]